MSRYDKFGDYLDSQNESFTIRFEKIEEIIGEKLSAYAYDHQAHWSNSDSHPLMKLVLSKNWKSRNLNLDSQEIEFYKSSESVLLRFVKKDMPPSMKANYQPIVIKTLLEKNKPFIASTNEIKEKLSQLNFDRNNFKVDKGFNTVMDVLSTYISNENDNVSFKEKPKLNEIPEILKICGQEIARWHIAEITEQEYEMWHILPGSRGTDFMYLDEFVKTNSIGIGWDKVRDVSNITESEIKQKFEEQYDEGWAGFQNFMKIKPKDIVVLTKGQEEISDFGIVVSDYEFRDTKDPSYPHRKQVVWLNRGSILPKELPTPTLAGFMTTCSRFVKRKQEMINVLLEKNTMMENNQYFILRHIANSPWDDSNVSSGINKYHFSKDVRNHKKIRNAGIGTKTIWFTTENEREYDFWGFGTVKEIETLKENEEWNLVYDDFTLFEKQEGSMKLEGKFLKRGNEQIKNDILNVENFNNQFSILQITKKIYEDITGEKTTMSDFEPKVDLSSYIETLQWKPNLVLYGPPGTGKTFHLDELKKELTKKNEEKFGICWPTDVDENKIEDFEQTIQEKGKVLWGIGWTPKTIDEHIFPITGYIYYKKNIIGIAEISNITSHENTPEDDLKKRSEKWVSSYDESSKNYIHITKIRRCNPFSHKELELIDHTKSMPDSVQAFHYVHDLEHEFVKFVTFHQSYSYEDFVEGIRPETVDGKIVYNLKDGVFKKICNDAKNDPNRDNKYVLIIDEVNRGNISKIFGELITLIEQDKREELSINLAYSQKKFTVPKNLYIICTMNTADKSLVQMDAALRRRFAFMELMPKYDLIDRKVGSVHLGRLLKTLNDKIRKENLRDKQIGHSYFMGITNQKELQLVFKYEIIPLLQDYFYDDYNLLEKILGKKIISTNDMSVKDIIDIPYELETELEKISTGKIETSDNSTDNDDSTT